MDIELIPLVDGKVSIRLDGDEVYLLPKKKDCTLNDIAKAIRGLLQNGGELSIDMDGVVGPPNCNW